MKENRSRTDLELTIWSPAAGRGHGGSAAANKLGIGREIRIGVQRRKSLNLRQNRALQHMTSEWGQSVDLNVEKSYILKTLALGLALIAGPIYPLVFMEPDLSQKLLAAFVMAVGGVIVFNCWSFHRDPVRHRIDEEGIWIYKNLSWQKKFVPWEEVVSFEPFNSTLHYGPIPYRREQMIHIHVAPTSRHFRGGKAEKPLALDFMGIREGRAEVMEQMQIFHQRKSSARSAVQEVLPTGL